MFLSAELENKKDKKSYEFSKKDITTINKMDLFTQKLINVCRKGFNRRIFLFCQ